MNRNDADKLTDEEFLALFGRAVDKSPRVNSADSDEYLTLVSYLVARASAR